MSRQLQNQQQKVIINLAQKPKRRKRRKKKSKATNSVGDFRTALARSAYIQRGVGGLGFNQPPPFLKNIDANAVRLNTRSQFEGTRRQRPTLKNAAIQTDNNIPLTTATGSIRGEQYTPRILPTEYSPFRTVNREIQEVVELYEEQEEQEEQEEETEALVSPTASSPIARRLRTNPRRSRYFDSPFINL